ncbi:hypothetical protein ABH930_005213 [Kitasatospora sp. GAS204A]|nr:hypothetical protein [Kitasatospora sp. GAS204B]MDH6117930.1 hypothetical protein [Kitasatospora sp. GAS204B]
MLAAQPQAWRRYLELALDGLRATGTRKLPYPPGDLHLGEHSGKS